MTVHIGQQNAGVINMAGRDQRIDGGQQGAVVAGETLAGWLGDLGAPILHMLPG
jgi:hypothetical protein